MTSDLKKVIGEESLPLLTLIAPYSITISVLYLMGYWTSFRINALEFVSLADVLKLAIYPMIGAVGGAIIGITYGVMETITPRKKALWTEKEKLWTIRIMRVVLVGLGIFFLVLKGFVV